MARVRAPAKAARRRWETLGKDSTEVLDIPDIFNIKPRIAAADGETPAAQHIFSRIPGAAQSEGGYFRADSRTMPCNCDSYATAGLIQRSKSRSPGVAHDALAGIAAGDVGELALEGGGKRNATDEFHFGRGRGEGGVMRRCGAIAAGRGA